MKLLKALALAFFLAAPARAAPPPAAPPAEPVFLRPAASVAEPRIKLGDLFSGTGPHADVEVANAPLPGERVTLGAAWLARMARAYRLDWRPLATDRVVVTRLGEPIDRAHVEALLVEALRRHGAGEDIAVELEASFPDIQVQQGTANRLEIQRLLHDRRSGRFSATLAIAVGTADQRRISLSGRAHELVAVPTPTRRIALGEVIAARDLVMQKIPTDQIAQAVMFDPKQFVGMAARRPLLTGRPIEQGDVAPPTLVTKNSIVTVTVRHPSMVLTAKAKALASGALGETVRVTNVTTNRVIDAVVSGAGAVEIGGPKPAVN